MKMAPISRRGAKSIDLFGGTLPGLPTPHAHIGGLVGVGFAGGGGASIGLKRAGLGTAASTRSRCRACCR